MGCESSGPLLDFAVTHFLDKFSFPLCVRMIKPAVFGSSTKGKSGTYGPLASRLRPCRCGLLLCNASAWSIQHLQERSCIHLLSYLSPVVLVCICLRCRSVCSAFYGGFWLSISVNRAVDVRAISPHCRTRGGLGMESAFTCHSLSGTVILPLPSIFS